MAIYNEKCENDIIYMFIRKYAHSFWLKTYGLLCRKRITYLKLFYKSNRPHFLWVYPTSRVGYHARKPLEGVVYCLNSLLYIT